MNKILSLSNVQYEDDLDTWNFLLCKREYPHDWPRMQRNHIWLSVTKDNRIIYADIHEGQMLDTTPDELFDYTDTRNVFNSLVMCHRAFLDANGITLDAGSLPAVETIELPNGLLVAE